MRASKVRVLVAEENARSRKVFKKSLEAFGHECLLAKDGLEAWELYQSTPEIDVVISDWTMPRIDGPELCRRIRKVNHAGYTYFILLSQSEDKEDHSALMRAGADEYLAEPLDT